MLGSKIPPLAHLTERDRRRRPVALLSLGAVGLALIVAGCGSATGASSAPSGNGSAGARPAPTTPAAKAPPTITPPTTTAAAKAPPAATATRPVPGTPQQNGGDADPDNNGGPDDGDGAI
jgi:hypothetical protein